MKSGKLGHFFSSQPEISAQTVTFKMGGHEGFSDPIVTHLVEPWNTTRHHGARSPTFATYISSSFWFVWALR
jgi:hypothetical protein